MMEPVDDWVFPNILIAVMTWRIFVFIFLLELQPWQTLSQSPLFSIQMSAEEVDYNSDFMD